MIVTAVRCLKCGDLIWSKSRHDFQYCQCNSCFIDGGRDYTRVGGDLDTLVMGSLDTDTNIFTVTPMQELKGCAGA